MIRDLTILYITASRLPDHWMKFQIDQLLTAIDFWTPIISVSRTLLPLGLNLIDSEPQSYWNIYMQMLRAAKLAKTPFVAMAEDDTLYTNTHFVEFRPPMDAVAYDRSRWSLFTWDNIYCLRNRISNCSMIAPRDYLIDALEERARVHPNGLPDSEVGEVGRERIEKKMGVSVRNCVEFYSFGPIVQLNHTEGSDPRQKDQWKRHGQLRAYDIPYWGKATDIIAKFKGTE
jgi:hypothetical protein